MLLRILDQAERAGDQIAIIDHDHALTYAELVERARALAGALRTHRHGDDPVVAVALPRSTAQIVALLACWLADMAYCPLDPAWPAARRQALTRRVRACAVIVSPDTTDLADFEDMPLVRPSDSGTIVPVPVAAPAALAYVIFTSGSTGEPKGVEVTHANLAALADWHCAAFALTLGIRTSHLAGLGFDAAAWEVWPTLAVGGTLVLASDAVRTDAEALRDWIVAQQVAIAFVPTALAEPMVAMAWPATTKLRTLLTGADRLTARPSPGQPFALINNYGPTECTVVATSGRVSAYDDGTPSIGVAIAGAEVHLLDPDGAVVAPGEVGEIWIGGDLVARGYRDDAEQTAARFVTLPRHGRCYRTGDLGRLLPGGEIAFEGRADDQIKLNGHRIEPGEVIAALRAIPGIAHATVALRGPSLIGWVVGTGGMTPDEGAIRAALAERLPAFMVPARIVSLPVIPLNASGKIDRAALPDPVALQPAGRAPDGPAEERLFDIVATVIGRRDFSVEDDFFLLGGHSLLGTQVVLRARDAFGVEVTLFHLFEGRTVESLARIVERLVDEAIAGMSDADIARLAANG